MYIMLLVLADKNQSDIDFEYISLEAFAKVPNEKIIIIYTDLKIQEQ